MSEQSGAAHFTSQQLNNEEDRSASAKQLNSVPSLELDQQSAAIDDGRTGSHYQVFFAEGRKFNKLMSNSDRRSAHIAITAHLSRIADSGDSNSVRDAVIELNKMLQTIRSPYRFTVSKISGKYSLNLRDVAGRLVATIPFMNPSQGFPPEEKTVQEVCNTVKALSIASMRTRIGNAPLDVQSFSAADIDRRVPELARHLCNIRKVAPSLAEEKISELNSAMEKSGKSIRFSISRMSTGQELLILLEENQAVSIFPFSNLTREFQLFVAFSQPKRALGLKKNLEVPVVETKQKPNVITFDTVRETFLQCGRRFLQEMPQSTRFDKHAELAAHLSVIRAMQSDRGVRQTLAQLNTELEAGNAPYRFTAQKMSNGQEFLSLKSQGQLIGTIPFTRPA